MFDLKQHLAEMWSPTDYGIPELNSYARKNMEPETRSGIRTLCLVFFFLSVGSALLNSHLKLGGLYLYTYSIMAVLSCHMFWSAQGAKGIKALYLLGTTLLVVSSTALVLLAHRTGSFTVPLFVSIVLIFMIIPLVPWGLKEALLVVLLISMVFTLSTWSVRSRFSMDTLLLLQFLLAASSSICLCIVGRNTAVRRKEIQNLYELELAKNKMQKLSCEDPLTGAWNRRYLKTRFAKNRQHHLMQNNSFYFVLFDIDNFKDINDLYGHDYGDHVLQIIVTSFQKHLGPYDVLIRMGGDEFALITSRDEPKNLLQLGMDTLAQKVTDEQLGADHIYLSFGIVRVPPDSQVSFKEVYHASDKGLYLAKDTKGNHIVEEPIPSSVEEKAPLLKTQQQGLA